MSVLKVPSNMEDPSVNLAERRLQAGVLGKLFGTGTNAARNIAGLIILLLIIGALVAYFWETDKGALFQIVVPIVTLGLGYLFGEKMAELGSR